MSSDRLMQALRAIIAEQFPNLKYLGLWDYTIQGVNGSAPDVTIDCAPSDDSIGLPELNGITMQPSISGMTGVPSAGMHCVVAFLDGSPTKPIIMGVDSLGANPVARLGDQVMSFFPPGTTVVGVSTGIPPGPFTGTIIVPNPITGSIVQGSGKAFTG